MFPFSAYILSHLCVTFVFLVFCRAVRASPWIGAVGQGLSVFVRATRGSFFLDNRTFFCPTDLFRGFFLCAKATDRSMLRVTNYSHQAWRRSTVGFFSPCLVLAGKKAAGLLRLRSSKRVVEKKNWTVPPDWIRKKSEPIRYVSTRTHYTRVMVHVSKPQFLPMS